jgi:hypothetical protein
MLVLILLYNFVGYISVEPREDMASCLQEAKTRLGENLPTIDPGFYQGGPPHVVAAFCAYGWTQ